MDYHRLDFLKGKPVAVALHRHIDFGFAALGLPMKGLYFGEYLHLRQC